MRSSNKLLLKIKLPHTEKDRKSLAYRGPKKWNALLEEFHRAPSKSQYKTMVLKWINTKAIHNNVSGNFESS